MALDVTIDDNGVIHYPDEGQTGPPPPSRPTYPSTTDWPHPPPPTTPHPTVTPRAATTTDPGGYGMFNQAYGGSLPAVGSYPPFEYDPFNAPDPFAPPSAQSVLDNDPGYGFRLGQGRQALEQSAAARGVLNTGGTLQDLVDYGQSFASNEYSNAYQRALGTYQQNFNDALNSYITNFGGALTRYNTNYQTQYANPYSMYLGQYDRNNSNYQNSQDRAFGQQYAVATA